MLSGKQNLEYHITTTIEYIDKERRKKEKMAWKASLHDINGTIARTDRIIFTIYSNFDKCSCYYSRKSVKSGVR